MRQETINKQKNIENQKKHKKQNQKWKKTKKKNIQKQKKQSNKKTNKKKQQIQLYTIIMAQDVATCPVGYNGADYDCAHKG